MFEHSKSNDVDFTGPQFRRLSDSQIETLHSASLEILERTGIRFHDEEVISLLDNAGAEVSENNRVRIPPFMVEEAFNTVPKKILLYNQEGEPTLDLFGHNTYFGAGSDCVNIWDHRSGDRREAKQSDIVEGIKLLDNLQNIDFIMSLFIPSDIPEKLQSRYQMQAMLENSIKPIIFVTPGFHDFKDVVRMAETVAGGEEALKHNPFAACYINITSPLEHNKESTQKLLRCSEKRLPFIYRPSIVLRGMISPVTVPGYRALCNASQLAGLVISQLKNKGAPFIFDGTNGGITDMKTSVGCHPAPENQGFAPDLAHYYGMPMFGLAGASDSKLVDGQATAEAAMSMVVDALSGVNLVHDVGYLEGGLTQSFEQIVICDELIDWIRHFMQGLKINKETLALDLIDEVGPDGDFINKRHTVEHMREDWYPELIDRGNYDSWAEKGKKTLKERANDKVRGILDSNKPRELPGNVKEKLNSIIEEAEEELL